MENKKLKNILNENIVIKKYKLILLGLIAGFCGTIIMYFFMLFGLIN